MRCSVSNGLRGMLMVAVVAAMASSAWAGPMFDRDAAAKALGNNTSPVSTPGNVNSGIAPVQGGLHLYGAPLSDNVQPQDSSAVRSYSYQPRSGRGNYYRPGLLQRLFGR